MFKKTQKREESVNKNGTCAKTESSSVVQTTPGGHIYHHSSSSSSVFQETKTEWTTTSSVSIKGSSSVGPSLGKRPGFPLLFKSEEHLKDVGSRNSSISPSMFKTPTRLTSDASPFKFGIANQTSSSIPTRPVNLNYQPLHPSRINPVTTSTTTYLNSPLKPFTNTPPSQPLPPTKEVPSPLHKKLKIVVKKATKFYDLPQICHKVPTYTTHSKPRGKLLLINNIKFISDKHLRRGAEIDEENLIELFRQMDFEIVKYRNLSKSELVKQIKRFATCKTLKKVDIGTVIIMSHGTGNDRSDSTHIIGTDGALIDSAWIINQFSTENCPYLAEKPKIVVFQCCRGDQFDLMQHKPDEHDTIPLASRKCADTLIAYSTAPGFVSHRNPEYGTWYIQALCMTFMEHAHNTHVEDMLKMVDRMLSVQSCINGIGQTGSFENRGFKNCYFHPKFYG